MCECETMLPCLKKFQIKPKPLQCTCNTQCWCNELTFRFPMEQIQGDCMSPKDILDLYGSDVTKKDKKYLEGLIEREFIPN